MGHFLYVLAHARAGTLPIEIENGGGEVYLEKRDSVNNVI